jgi:hypothetical protein
VVKEGKKGLRRQLEKRDEGKMVRGVIYKSANGRDDQGTSVFYILEKQGK